MSIIQMLFLGGRLPIVLDPYRSSSTGTKPRVTVINPEEISVSLGASVYSVTAEVWGGGGASGSAFQGRSGAGGGGGYASAIIPTKDLSISELHLRVAGGGGGISTNGGEPGGTNVYYDQPLDEYGGVNTATIEFFGSSSVASSPTYSTITSVASTSVKSDISYSDIISIGSTSIRNTISYSDVISMGSTSIRNTISYAGITSVGSASIRDNITYSSVTSVGSTGVRNIFEYLPIEYIGSISGVNVTSLDISSLNPQVGDVILVASVCDTGTLNTPTAVTTPYTSLYNDTEDAPSYQVSYFTITNPVTQSTISNLTASTGSGGNFRLVAHIASVYRGVDTASIIAPAASTDVGDPNPPSITTDVVNYTAVAIGFVDDIDILDSDITAPTDYINKRSVAVVDAVDQNSTIMMADRNINSIRTENPNIFDVTPTPANDYAAVTIGFKPLSSLITSADTLNLPVGIGITTNDIVLLASVSDGGTLVRPSGYTSISSRTTGGPSYELSWRRLTSSDFTGSTPNPITGLTATVSGFDACHAALIFRGAATSGNPTVTNATTSSGNPDAPSILADTFNYTSVAFGFLSNKSIADVSVTAPTNYTKAITQAVGTNASATDEATLMTAYRLLSSFKGTEDPGAFGISPTVTDAYAAITVGLKPQPTVVTDASTLSLPGEIQTNDIILVASVSDNGTLATPSGYTSISSSTTGGPSYQLSYKRVGVTMDTQVSGLSSNITDSSGVKNEVAHVALVFRGVVSTGTPFVTNSATGTTNPNPPSITTNTINFTSVAFGFLDDKSITTITPPTGYTTARNQAVGTNASSIYEATIMSAYKSLTTFGLEDPGTFTGTGVTGDNIAVTVGLRPQPTTVVDARTLSLPSTQQNDIILLSSVCNSGTLTTPAGYTLISSSTGGGPSYQLSYKRVGVTTDTQVTGLTSITSSNGIDFDVAHTATVFQGVVVSGTPIVSNNNTGTGNPNSPAINVDTINYTAVSFGFLDDVSATSITPPSGYTTLVNQEVGTTGITTTQATIMSAYKQLTILSEDPGAFTGVSGTNAAVTVGLKPQPTTVVDARTLPLPSGLQQDDIILLSSVCNSGTLTIPSGYTTISSSTTGGPSYQLSYKRVGVTTDTQVTGLTSITSSSGINFDVAHTAAIFRGVTPGEPLVSNSNTGTGNPNSPAIIADTVNYASVSFGFLDNVSSTSITPPTDYSTLVNQEVGTVGITTTQATIISAYKSLSVSGSEDPGAFTGVSGTNVAVTIGLRPKQTISTNANVLTLPSPSLQTDDVILVASVSDGGTLTTPVGYTTISSSTSGGPSYQLSYKRLTSLDLSNPTEYSVTGLTATGTIQGSPGVGETAGVSHIATVFRGVSTTGVGIATSNVLTGTGTPDPPAITSDTVNFMSVAFGFLDDKSITSITPPTNYTTAINQAVGTDPTGTTQATIMSAYRSLSSVATEDPGTFNIGGSTDDYVAVTVGLRPQLNLTANTDIITLPPGLETGDIILVASVSDGGTMNIPSGYTSISSSSTGSPSYQLSYKRVGATPDTQVTGLSPSGLTDTGSAGGPGNPAGVSHIALVFRGTSTTINPRITTSTANNNNTSPNPPSISSLINGDAVVAFGFLDDKSITSITPPTGYTVARNQAVGSDPDSNIEATLMSAYRILSSTSGTEDPGSFGSIPENNVAISLALRPQTNNKFSSRTGGCGGSGGGYSGVFYGGTNDSNRIPLIVVGGGGGGGGACVATSLGGFVSTAVAGSGAPGGGTIAAAGENGSLIFDTNISDYRLAGSGGGGGGDGITVFGGSSGKTWSFPGVVSTGTNPGEVGVLYSTAPVAGFYTGGRGANSPYNDLSAIPLYGANSSGGWLRGSGGGSSRTSSGIIPVLAPTDCGGAGGAGYYGGGGGGSGYGGGGGGGGGGSSFIDSNLSVLSNNSGIGTVPGNTESLNYINGVGYGGTSVLGLGITDVIGNSGGPGMIILTLATL